jgi:hypothetical protein
VDQLLEGAIAELVEAAQDHMTAGRRRCGLFHVHHLLPEARIGTCREELSPGRWLSPGDAVGAAAGL